MKRKVGYWLLLSISVILFGCSNDEEINRDFTFIGTVIDASSKEPMPELPVVVTDGNNIHTSTKTNADGRFMLTVNINEISSAYYILIGDDSCIKKTVEIHGFSGGETNLGTIEIIGPSIPSVRLNGHKTDNGIITCNASITANGRLEVVEKGFCFGKTAQPTIDDEKIVCGSGDGSFQGKITITDLDVSSTYFIRPYATNAKGTGYGEEFSTSTEDGLPSIESLGTGSIKATSASLGGRLISNGGYEVTERGVCWDKDGTPSVEDNYKFIDGQETINYWIDVDGLSPNTKYYMRAYAKNKHGIAYGGIENFTTKDGLPDVSTQQPTATATTITTSGVINDDGGFPIMECGVCYSTTTDVPTINGSKVISNEKSGTYYLTIPDLPMSTLYYIRAYATNENGTSYGKSLSVSTTSGKPVVSTSTSYTSGKDFLIISGSATTEANAPILRKGICWSSHTNPSINDKIEIASSNTEFFTCRIDGLQSWSTYYCRAFAENSYGLSYGEVYQFSTERTPARLLGQVLDQDGNPIANASVRGYDNWLGTTSDKDGHYIIEFAAAAHGEYQFTASATDYESSGVQTINIIKGQDNYFDFVLNLASPWAIDLGTGVFKNTGTSWEIVFECTQSSFAGQKTIRNIRLKNYRSVPVSWEITNIPTTGVTLSQTKGTIPANGEISLTLTFTYPSTSSYMVQLPGCSSGTKTYVYNWDMVNTGCYFMNGNYYDAPCYACCGQNVIVNVGDYTEAFSLIFNQKVSYK